MSQVTIENYRVLPEAISNTSASNYLGNAVVVNKLVGEFCAKVEAVYLALSVNGIKADQAVNELVDVVTTIGDIFSGRNNNYTIITGYNDVTLGGKLMADLGSFWIMQRSEWGDDPIYVLFAWLSALILESAKKADGDDMLMEIMLKPSIQYTVKVLLGIEERVKSSNSGDLSKSHVNGYTKKNGTFVAEHNDKRVKSDNSAVYHPKKGMKGEKVVIKHPHEETRADTWDIHNQIATVLPNGLMPYEINDVVFDSWTNHPRTDKDWADVEGQLIMDEPELVVPKSKKPASGVVIEEDDGRIWLIHPTNSFGGYDASFPKGGIEDGLSMQANAIKEAYEESGLQVEITGFIGDVVRTTSVARYYSARRVGGDPADMGWESQAVSLVPVAMLDKVANTASDAALIKMIKFNVG